MLGLQKCSWKLRLGTWNPGSMKCRHFIRHGSQRSRASTRQTCTVLLVLSALITFYLCNDDKTLHYDKSVLEILSTHPLINWTRDVSVVPTCHIQLYSAFSEEILPYFKIPPKHIRCKDREKRLSRLNLTTNELEIFENASTYRCQLQDLYRDGDDKVVFINTRSVGVGFHKLNVFKNQQAIHVGCINFLGLTVYSHLHLIRPKFVPRSSLNGSRAGAPLKNVLIFGIDSVSNLAAVRLLPQTYLYLVNNLSAVVLQSHHKVGDNTFPNLITILTGEKRTHPADTPFEKDQRFDSWPLIWKDFSRIGYETFYGEDFPKFSTFNYLSKGFKEPPTDHYLRPFWLAVENLNLLPSSSNLCYGATPKHELQLDYLKNFIQTKRQHPYFAFSFLVEISHEYQELLGAADKSIVDVLKTVESQVTSGETILIFLSDHGHRFDSIRQTHQGHLEERLPFVAIATADSAQKSVLNYNRDMLTSHYDLFEILRSLLPESSRPQPSRFGIDILSHKVPWNRACPEAGIDDIYCTCENDAVRNAKEADSDFSDSDIRRFAIQTVSFINHLLRDEVVCAPLSLRRVVSTFLKGVEKLITLETSPGGAIFEVRFKSLSDDLREDQFSRINRYGKPCIPSLALRKYCHCDK